MTVREKSKIAKALATTSPKAIWARSLAVGELQVQAIVDGKPVHVFLKKERVNLLLFAPASAWKQSQSLMGAIRANQAKVSLE